MGISWSDGAGDDCRVFLGVDIGGTTISVGLVTERGDLVGGPDCQENGKKPRVKSEPLGADHDPSRVAGRVRALADAALADAGRCMDEVVGVGVATPGLIDAPSGIVNVAANLSGWRDVHICDLVASALEVDRERVVLENDTNAALLAEVWIGAAVGRQNVVLMTLGTGIGGAIMCDGRLLRGSKGQAGEIGHSILVPDGKPFGGTGVSGIFEGYASASAVAQRASEGGGPPRTSSLHGATGPVECVEVFRHAEQGDKYAAEIVQEAARCLAIGCINCCRFVDPEVVIFSGGMAQAGEALLGRVREQFAAYHWNIEAVRLEIVQAAAVASSGVIGAAFAARQRADGER